MDILPDFLVWYAVFLFTLAFHESSHALVAHLGGDDTAYHGGQVTLNPWPHIRREPLGTVLVPILTFFGSGWMMGWASAPYDRHWGQRHPRRLAAMSAAGPAANLTLAAAAFVILRVLLATGYFVAPYQPTFSHVVTPAPERIGSGAGAVALLLSVTLNLNVLLGLFNLLPLPPLDGAGVVQGLFPGSIGGFLASLSGNPMFMIAGMVVAWRVFGVIFPRVFSILLALLHPGVYS